MMFLSTCSGWNTSANSYPKLSTECFFSYIETRRICFLFRLGDDAEKKTKRNQSFNSLSKSKFFLLEPSYNLVTRVSLLGNEMKRYLKNEVGHPYVVARATDISIGL